MEFPVVYQGLFYSRNVMVPTPRKPVSPDRRILVSAFADQVGAALAALGAVGV